MNENAEKETRSKADADEMPDRSLGKIEDAWWLVLVHTRALQTWTLAASRTAVDPVSRQRILLFERESGGKAVGGGKVMDQPGASQIFSVNR